MDLTLIGAGRVGTAVAALLRNRGHRILGVASRSRASAERAAGFLEAQAFELAQLPRADAALLGVPAGALEGLAAEAARLQVAGIVCHFAGAVGIGPLRPAVDAGISAAALHPVQTCPDVATAISLLPGSAWGVTTSPGIAGWARGLVAVDLGGVPVDVAEDDRALWHAAAVVTANGTAALLAAGEAMLAAIGIADPAGVLGPLAAGSVTTARLAANAGGALTGPVVRGEAAMIANHVDALRARAPELLDAYRLVTETIILAAAGAQRIDSETAGSIREVLGR